jgi:hypothetical protein
MQKQDYGVLEDIFVKVNEWLRFAEAKNAVLVALIGSVFFAFLDNPIINGFKDNLVGKLYYYNVLLFLLLGFATSLMSFLPQTRLFHSWAVENTPKEPNVFFFGHLSSMTSRALIQMIYSESSKLDNELQYIRLCVAEQIITNSRIANRKYSYFRLSLWFVMTAMFTPIVSLLLFLFVNTRWGDTKRS